MDQHALRNGQDEKRPSPERGGTGRSPANPREKVRVGQRGARRVQIHFSAEVLAQYRAGHLLTGDVAELYGVCWQVAARELRRAGVPIHGRGRPQPGRVDRERFAARLRARRQSAGLTQKQLATRSGLSRVTVSFLESAHRYPSPPTLRQLAKALGVRVEVLLPPAK